MSKELISTADASRQLIYVVWTRDIEIDQSFGRVQVALSVRRALESSFDIDQGILASLVSERSIWKILRCLIAYAASMLRFKPLPLQCVLFADPREIRRVVRQISPRTKAVYVDGIRCLPLVRVLRRARPDLAIITDLDDLMSRRMDLLLKSDTPPSTGYMKDKLPKFVERLLNSRMFSRALMTYERETLRLAERDMVSLCEATVLLSQKDVEALVEHDGDTAKVHSIPPPVHPRRAPKPYAADSLRFVFIGSDTLRQNQLSIDYLIAAWARHRFSVPLVIFGKQKRTYDLPDKVSMPGFVDTIEEVYDGVSVLVSPSFLAGGLKTKVIEAFSYGAAVVGNAITFEAMNIGDYPLLFEKPEEMLAFLRAPEQHLAQIDAAASSGWNMIRAHHDPAHFSGSWRNVIDGAIRVRSERYPQVL